MVKKITGLWSWYYEPDSIFLIHNYTYNIFLLLSGSLAETQETSRTTSCRSSKLQLLCLTSALVRHQIV
jgi:hypothetical protein